MGLAFIATGVSGAAPPDQQTAHPLDVVRGASARIVDDLGRTVLLRGINVNQLAEYYTDNPANPSTIPLARTDFSRIAGLGFNVVRLLTSWSRWEPTPGRLDDAYLARIKEAIGWACDADLYVLVDMHQDAWGPHINTPPTETCLPGTTGNVGWDGAPRWATITDGLPTCKVSLRELAPAVGQAWTNFYLDRAGPGGVGIQTRLVATWGRIAGALAGEPGVIGYDLLNEPNPGYFVHDLVALGRFYDRAIGAIRSGERAAGGARRLVFFEPSALWSAATAHPTPAPVFTADPAIVFAPHVYAASLSADGGILSPAEGHDLAALWAGVHQTVYWSGEWGWFGDPAEAAADVLAYAREEDARLVGGAWWSWKQACGDPHQIGTPGNPPGRISPSLVRFACPGDREVGIPAQFGTVLSRAYAWAAPGLASMTSEVDTGALRVTGTKRGTLDIWVPDRGRGAPVVTGAPAAGVVLRGGSADGESAPPSPARTT